MAAEIKCPNIILRTMPNRISNDYSAPWSLSK